MMSNTYLAHYGIKGQKWGVRRWQNKDMSLTPEGRIHYGVGEERSSIKKGDIRNSISGQYQNGKKYLKSGRPIYTYDPRNEWDNQVYKGPFAKYTASRGYQYIAEFGFKAVKDINMPTKSERINEFKNVMNDPKIKKSAVQDLNSIQQALKYYNAGSKEAQNVNLKKLKTDSDYKAAYEIFNHAMESQHRFKVTSEYMNRMKNKYDAMIDDNNKDIYNKAQDPIIILNAEAFTVTRGGIPIKYLKRYEMESNTNIVRRELNKTGDVLKLGINNGQEL